MDIHQSYNDVSMRATSSVYFYRSCSFLNANKLIAVYFVKIMKVSSSNSMFCDRYFLL